MYPYYRKQTHAFQINLICGVYSFRYGQMLNKNGTLNNWDKGVRVK